MIDTTQTGESFLMGNCGVKSKDNYGTKSIADVREQEPSTVVEAIHGGSVLDLAW